MEEMWNAAFKEHQLRNPQCEGILLCDLGNEEKRGFGTRQQLICTKWLCNLQKLECQNMNW